MIKLPDDDSKPKKRKDNNKTNGDKWIVFVTVISFFLSAFFLFISNVILEDVSAAVAIVVLLIIIFTGVIADAIGIAVTAADEAPFHAMASRKFYGAKRAIKLVKNADKVANFCNDVIGDICGIISGTASALILIKIVVGSDPRTTLLISLAITGMIASLTIGGKAVGKRIAMKNSNEIIYKVGVFLQIISLKGRSRR